MNHIATTAPTRTNRHPKLVRGSIAALALLAVAALTPGCSVPEAAGQPVAARPTTTQTQAPTSPSPAPESSAPESTTTINDAGLDDDAYVSPLGPVMVDATDVTDAYWAEHWTEFFTGTYTAPEVVGLYDGTDPQTAPVCDGEPLEAGNARYCSESDYVAWDLGLMENSTEIGDSFVYLVIAHEWAHAIQARLDPSLVWSGAELQADCLAGATIYGAIDDGSLTLTNEGQKHLVDGLNFGGEYLPWTDPGDHGDSFERIDAFNLGRNGGVEACLPAE